MGIVCGPMRECSMLEERPVTDFLLHELILVETTEFGVFADTKGHEWDEFTDVFHDDEQTEGDREGIGGDGSDVGKLASHLHADTIDSSGCQCASVEGGNRLRGKATGQEGADHAADSVELEHIHTLVDADPVVDVLER